MFFQLDTKKLLQDPIIKKSATKSFDSENLLYVVIAGIKLNRV